MTRDKDSKSMDHLLSFELPSYDLVRLKTVHDGLPKLSVCVFRTSMGSQGAQTQQ